jgi:uncharacterized protein with HEPN domain
MALKTNITKPYKKTFFMSERDPQLLVGDILDCAYKIQNYTDGISFKQFIIDSKTIDAVIRNFETIGEAANKLLEEFKEKYTDINWYRIRGFRNRIIHNYFGVDYTVVWQI